MYHGILRGGPARIGSPVTDADSLAAHLAYLKRHFRVVHPSEIGAAPPTQHSAERRVALTFDDGFGNNATQAMPLLEETRTPALFFVSTRHLTAGRFLWFTHALAVFALFPGSRVELLQKTWELTTLKQRGKLLEEFVARSRNFPFGEIYADLARYPVEAFTPPDVIENEMRGLTEAELHAMAQNSMFEIGAHTRDHPVLTTCTDEELDAQLVGGRKDIERICGRPPLSFAYPEGYYDGRVIERVQAAGFRKAFAVRVATRTEPDPFTIPRVGVYSDGLGSLAAKAHGWLRG
jgi:peptidoglycan/xylan/chitin deacetylase (PgdA/CDA1 family)